MKKIIFTFILIITFSSNAFSDHFYKNWGVVVDIKPIYYNQVINKPTTHKINSIGKISNPLLYIDKPTLSTLIKKVGGGENSPTPFGADYPRYGD